MTTPIDWILSAYAIVLGIMLLMVIINWFTKRGE